MCVYISFPDLSLVVAKGYYVTSALQCDHTDQGPYSVAVHWGGGGGGGAGRGRTGVSYYRCYHTSDLLFDFVSVYDCSCVLG